MVVFKMIVLQNDFFIKLVFLLSNVNNDPSLSIVNDEPLLPFAKDH